MRRRWWDLEWIDRFGYTVMTCFGLSILGLVACAAMNDDSPVLPSTPLGTFTVVTTVPPPTVLDCGAQVPADDCADGPGISTTTSTLLASQSP
jgi:hypothetical protein